MSQLSGYEAVILVVYASAVGVGDRARSTGTGAVEGAGRVELVTQELQMVRADTCLRQLSCARDNLVGGKRLTAGSASSVLLVYSMYVMVGQVSYTRVGSAHTLPTTHLFSREVALTLDRLAISALYYRFTAL